MLFNIRAYALGMLFPWFCIALAAFAMSLREHEGRVVRWVGGWTVACLFLVYGQSVYQDHIGVNVVSSGNSFIRYMLPLAPLVALAAAYLVERIEHHRFGKLGVLLFTFGILFLGVWTVLGRDDENIWRGADEIARYNSVRSATESETVQQAVVLSDRSDKIFFPHFRAVSPMPSDAQALDLISRSGLPVYYYGNAMDEEGYAKWKARGFLLRPTFASGKERLYEMLQSVTGTHP
jgi:hypothetical protein